jgi:hypothetical protein
MKNIAQQLREIGFQTSTGALQQYFMIEVIVSRDWLNLILILDYHSINVVEVIMCDLVDTAE